MARRAFFRSAAAIGSGAVLTAGAAELKNDKKSEDLNVALIGYGTQGQLLLGSCLKIPGIRFRAVCDIWKDFNLDGASQMLRGYNHEHRAYVDYREMLEKERQQLDAVIIATPDFCHAEQAAACLKAGLHVYCEAPMSNTVEGARQMVQAARESRKLLQIGQQRRSNPRYMHCCTKVLPELKLLGQITAVDGQWNRSVQPDRGWPKRATMDEATLARYGYPSMQQFRNWQWYKKLGGGPVAEFGSHQIDVFNWLLDARPTAVMAGAGTEYYDRKTHEWSDTVMVILDYPVKQKTVRVLYQIVTSNGNLGHYEKFLGAEGALVISEAAGLANLFREPNAPDWGKWVNLGFLIQTSKRPDQPEGTRTSAASITETVAPTHYTIPVESKDPVQKPHLENFFAAIQGKAQLHCPAEVGYAAAVTVSKIHEAIETGQKISLKPEDFQI
jgi:predicted dehydrogenase